MEQLTGIKAHTLRIWEKRYKSLVPHRTPTNIRYYDDKQLKRLLNISTLLHNGHKISSVSALTDEKLNELIISLLNENNNVDTNELYVTVLTNHMLAFDERSFDKVLSSVIIKLGVYEAVLKVIYPFLRKSGVLWITSNATPSQEHFASNIIKRKLFAAIDGIPYPVTPKGKFALFLPPEEWHEIGLLVSDFLIRSAGWETIYLGQNVPYSSLEIVLSSKKVDYLLTFFTCVPNIEKEASTISAFLSKYNVNAFICAPTKAKIEFKNITFLESPSALFAYL